jgi:hypothetical protein
MELKYVSLLSANTAVTPLDRIGISYYFTTQKNFVRASVMLLTSLGIPNAIPDNAAVNSIYIRSGFMVIRLQNVQTSIVVPTLQDILISMIVTLRLLRTFHLKPTTPSFSAWERFLNLKRLILSKKIGNPLSHVLSLVSRESKKTFPCQVRCTLNLTADLQDMQRTMLLKLIPCFLTSFQSITQPKLITTMK